MHGQKNIKLFNRFVVCYSFCSDGELQHQVGRLSQQTSLNNSNILHNDSGPVNIVNFLSQKSIYYFKGRLNGKQKFWVFNYNGKETNFVTKLFKHTKDCISY